MEVKTEFMCHVGTECTQEVPSSRSQGPQQQRSQPLSVSLSLLQSPFVFPAAVQHVSPDCAAGIPECVWLQRTVGISIRCNDQWERERVRRVNVICLTLENECQHGSLAAAAAAVDGETR